MKSFVSAGAIVFFLGSAVCHAQIEIQEKYILGEWCLNVEEMFDKSNAGISNLEFMTDGKYRLTPSKDGAAENEGSYTIHGAFLDLKPLLPMLKIETLTDDEMIGVWFEDYRFTKGNCAGGADGGQVAAGQSGDQAAQAAADAPFRMIAWLTHHGVAT